MKSLLVSILIVFLWATPSCSTDNPTKAEKIISTNATIQKNNTNKNVPSDLSKSNLSSDDLTSSKHSKSTDLNMLNEINKYADLISASVLLLTVFVMLYLGVWREKLQKPKLQLCFNQNKLYPYFQKLSFGSFERPVEISNKRIDIISKPGFNARVKIKNIGKSTAKRVQAYYRYSSKFTFLFGCFFCYQ
jgi:hypothetical protein